MEFAFHGGLLSWRQLRGVSRAALRRLMAEEAVVRDSRGHYALAHIDGDERLARSCDGVRIGLSAAMAHGWGVARRPLVPQLAVARGTRRPPPGAVRRTLTPSELRTAVTSPLKTVLDCARTLPFPEALAVADSALRSGLVGSEELTLAAGRLRGPGVGAARRVARDADARAAGPFESVTRALCLTVDGLRVTPQVTIADERFFARVDLADELARIVIECDSFTWHGSRAALVRDARRYNALVVRGWTVLRLTWDDVWSEPELTRQVLEAAGARTSEARPA